MKISCLQMSGIEVSKPFMLMITGNTIPNRINVVIYLKSIFFSEKFVYADTEIAAFSQIG